MLVADLAQLLLCDPKDGDIPTLDYPRAKNCIQAAMMWELERVDSIRVGATHVTRGDAPRPCPLGAEFEPWLASLDRPEPQSHNWFRLRMDPEVGLITEFFSKRLVAAGLADQTSVSHLLFFKKAAYPLTAEGEKRRAELRERITRVVHALEAGPLTLSAFQPEEWMLAFFLDAMRILPRALGIKKQDKCLISAEALETMLGQSCLSLGLAKSTYEFSRDAGDLDSLLRFGFDALDFVTNVGEEHPSGPTYWGNSRSNLGKGAKILKNSPDKA